MHTIHVYNTTSTQAVPVRTHAGNPQVATLRPIGTIGFQDTTVAVPIADYTRLEFPEQLRRDYHQREDMDAWLRHQSHTPTVLGSITDACTVNMCVEFVLRGIVIELRSARNSGAVPKRIPPTGRYGREAGASVSHADSLRFDTGRVYCKCLW